MRILPTPPDPEKTPHATITVSLSGRSYQTLWLWNQRDRAWYFSLSTASGEPIALSVRVVLGAILNVGANRSVAPPHPILVLDVTGDKREPTLTSLGKNVQVVYMEPDA